MMAKEHSSPQQQSPSQIIEGDLGGLKPEEKNSYGAERGRGGDNGCGSSDEVPEDRGLKMQEPPEMESGGNEVA